MLEKRETMDARKLICSVCGAHDGIIHKYGLNLCRRCFKDNAINIGFRKYS